ncbi:MAG: hypothetical protein AB9836_11250 [Aminipila sp.]
MNIRVRREVLRCSKCKNTNEFLYLSDFSYGERLIRFDDAKQYAYINLLEDTIFNDFEQIVRVILKQYNYKINEEKLINIINETFGITCDKIMGNEVEFLYKEEKCSFCSSNDFESLLAEPEKVIEIDVPVITHQQWEILNEDEKKELIEKELKLRKILQ